VGTSTDPAHVAEGSHVQAHRAKLALPFRPQQVELADAGDDVVDHDQGIRDRGGIPSLASHPRHEDLSPEGLLARGDASHGTPDAPCGRRCRANGYDAQSDSRQDVGGRPCPLPAREPCPHGPKVRGETHRMSVSAYPRLMGPRPRGTEAWQILSGARTASARTNSDAHEGIDHGRPPKLRGLKAVRFLGAIRTVAHLLRRA